MVDEKSNKEVSEIKIERSFKVEKEAVYLIVAILSFIIIFIIILIFGFIYLTKPEALFSPPTIDSFLGNLNESYDVVISDGASVEEGDLIGGFVLGFGNLKIFKQSEFSKDNRVMIIGIRENLIDVPYLEYLKDNDSVVIYDVERDSLYIYSKDLDSLKEVLDILKNSPLEYSSIKVNNGVVEELVT